MYTCRLDDAVQSVDVELEPGDFVEVRGFYDVLMQGEVKGQLGGGALVVVVASHAAVCAPNLI